MNSSPDLTMTQDAENWRELRRLLAAKAYGAMKPAQIAALLPDLREMHKAISHHSATTTEN